MKAIVNYLRDLYSLDEKKPSRGDFIAQLALLWVMNLLFLLPAYGSVLPSFLLSRIGVEYVAAYSSYVQLSSLITGLGIPWIFFMALASFFTIRRVYGRQFHPVFQAFGALSIYIFFRYIVLVIYWVLGFAELLGSPSELVPMVNQGHRNLLVALFPLALLGLLLILHSLITLKPSVNVPAKSKELGPAKYSAYYLLYHFICTILSLTMAAVSIHKFNGDFDSPMMIFSAVLLSIVAMIIYITLMVRRIRNSGYSLFILGVLLFPIILSTIAWMVYLVLIRQLTLALWFSPLFMITITQILFSIALGIPGVFQIWMMVVPSKAESL